MSRVLTAAGLASLLLLVAATLGCTGRNVIRADRYDILRLGPGVRGRVYILNTESGGWELSANVIDYPELYYIVDSPD